MQGVPKTVYTLACCNYDIHEQILIIYGRNVAEKQAIKICFVFPPQLINVCTLLAKQKT